MKYDGLTERQLEVATLVSEGLTDKQIGDALSISEETVAFHVQRIATEWKLRDEAGKNIRVQITRRVLRAA